MKRDAVLFIIGVLFTAIPATAQSKVFERTLRITPGGSLRLQAGKGSIRLTGWDQDQVEIRARIEADEYRSTDYARRAVDATTVDVMSAGNGVTIRSNYDNVPRENWLFGYSRTMPDIHYEIRAPKRLDLRLDIDRSRTVVSGFEGRMDMDADRSEIDAADLTGPVHVSIQRGGDSSFRNVRGSFNVSADRTNLRIDMTRLDAASRIEIDRGDADVSLPRGQGINLDTALSRRASVNTNLPIQLRGGNREHPSGPVNGGGPRLAIEADRSQVRLR